MKRITFVLLYALLAATTAPAQVWIGGTNEKSGVVAPLLYTNFLAGSFRVTVAALDGGSPIDLSLDRVSLQVEDTRDGKLVVSNTCIRLDDYTYRGEGSLSASPSPYTLKVQVYPAANPSAFYPIYWASVAITSPSAAAAQVSITSTSVVDLGNVTVQWEIQGDGDLAPDGTDRTIVPHTDGGADLGRTDERFRSLHVITAKVDRLYVAGDADVGGTLSALDNSRVLRVGETNTVDLTNASVQARSPTGDVEVATKGYVDSVAGGTANLGTVQFYTNTVGIWYTNRLGYPEPLRPNTIPSTDWTIFHGYDGPEDLSAMSNLNVTGSAWTYMVTNGALWIVGPNESGTARFFDLLPVTSGVWSRAAMHILVPLQYSYWVNGNYGYGMSCYDSGLTNSALHGRRSNSFGDNLETYIFNRFFSESQDTRYVSPYTAGSSSVYTYLWGWKDITIYAQHDGTNTLMWFIGAGGTLTPSRQYVATNTAPAIGWAIMAQSSYATAGGTNSCAFGIDWMGVKEGALWFAPQ